MHAILSTIHGKWHLLLHSQVNQYVYSSCTDVQDRISIIWTTETFQDVVRC